MAIIADQPTTVRCGTFGRTRSGREVLAYTLSNATITARVLTYGGILHSVIVPDRDGNKADVVLGYDDLAGYEADRAFHGAIIGRYANRIAGAQFRLDGEEYHLPANDSANCLHGGPAGFHKQIWESGPISDGVELTYVSKSGEEGFPGAVTSKVRYLLRDRDLRIEYHAVTSTPTVLNLTNHAYFNLAGEGHGDILGHEMCIRATKYTPINARLIPTGEFESVERTPLDFRSQQPIGTRIGADFAQLKLAGGYDHNWVPDPHEEETWIAEAHEPKSGRGLQVFSDQPGIQFYSGNFLNGARGKGGKPYAQRSGLCLETQHYPDSPNQQQFPSTVLRPGEEYKTATTYRFLAR